MNIFNLLFGAVFIVLMVCYYFAGSYNSITSLFSILLSMIAAYIAEDHVVNWLAKLGWKENVYSPSFILVMLFIIFLGIFFAAFSYLHSNRSVESRLKRIVFAILSSVVTTIAVSNLLCFALPAFFTSQETALRLKNSAICVGCLASKFETIKPKSLQNVQERAITTETDYEVVVLPENYMFLGQSSYLESRLLELINQTRLSSSVNELTRDEKLDQVALSYAKDMVKTKRFSHIDLQNNLPSDRAKSVGINFNYYGENLAVASTVDKAHEAIMLSESHRDNLLSTAYRQVGIAVINVAPNEVLVVEEFSN